MELSNIHNICVKISDLCLAFLKIDGFPGTRRTRSKGDLEFLGQYQLNHKILEIFLFRQVYLPPHEKRKLHCTVYVIDFIVKFQGYQIFGISFREQILQQI